MFGPDMPVPTIDPDTEEFWRACREHRLVVQRCADCGAYRFAPAPVCHRCQSFATEFEASAGRGTLYTWTVVHQVMHPAVEQAVPYNVAVVRLDDCGGAMITTNIVDVGNDDLVAGMPVELVWDDVTDDCALPRFTPARPETDA